MPESRHQSHSKNNVMNKTFQEERMNDSMVSNKKKRPAQLADFKNLVESSSIINEIFHQRSLNIESRKQEQNNQSGELRQEINNQSPSLHSNQSPSNKSVKPKSPFRQNSQSPFTPKISKSNYKDRSTNGSRSQKSNMLIH